MGSVSEIQQAWQKAQDAWVAAGSTLPCYDEAYMTARAELSAAYARAEEDWRRRQRHGQEEQAQAET
jgi:hypothetical protein